MQKKIKYRLTKAIPHGIIFSGATYGIVKYDSGVSIAQMKPRFLGGKRVNGLIVFDLMGMVNSVAIDYLSDVILPNHDKSSKLKSIEGLFVELGLGGLLPLIESWALFPGILNDIDPIKLGAAGALSEYISALLDDRILKYFM